MGLKALIYYVAFMVPAVFGFATFSILTHLISPAEYALYSTSVNLAYFAASAFFSWITFSAARYEAEARGPIATRFWLLCFAGSAPVALIFLSTAWLLGFASLRTAAGIFALCTAQSLFNITQEFRRARHESQIFMRYNLFRSVVSVFLAVPVAYWLRDGLLLIFTLSFSFLVAAAFNLFRLVSTANTSPTHAYDLRTVFSYGAGLAASGIVFASVSVISRLMVVHISGIEKAGPYNATLDLTGQIAGIVAMSVFSVISPTIFRSYAGGDMNRVMDDFRRGAELLLASVAPTTAGLMLVAVPLSQVFTGPDFQPEIAVLLPWIVLALAIWNISHYYVHIAFQVASRPVLQAVAGLFQVLLLVAIGYPFITHYGPIGGAQAMVLTNLATLIITICLARKVFPIPFPLAAFAKVAICTACLIAAVLPLTYVVTSPVARLALESIAGAVAYCAAALAVNLCSCRDVVAKLVHRWR